MKPETLGLLIGGIAPALFFSFTNVSVKLSTEQGIATPYYVMFVGAGVFCVGAALYLFWPEKTFTSTGGVFAFSAGLLWALGMSCVAFALSRYNATIAQLTPLFNMNTLITVLIALWVFAEWKQVKIPQLLIGSVLIVIGGTLVARA